jgi:primosomal protein N' (replication factor Y) (superfamily II helicase)
MHYLLICPVGVIGGQSDSLTYHYDVACPTGTVVKIPFGKKTVTGVVVDTVAKPGFTTKAIAGILSETLTPELLQLAIWMSEYYASRLSLVLQAMLPRGLGTERRIKNDAPALNKKTKNLTLSSDQQKALNAIRKSKDITHLLHGVTGSGKTTVYRELAKDNLSAAQSVLILVPEIALTPQLAGEFAGLGYEVTVLHSGLTEAQRHILWQKILVAKKPLIIIGPRSALFSPLKNIGLIVVDECHEPSYQQDSQPKYSALRVARKLAELHPGSKLVLGSATPLLTDYFIAQSTNTKIVQLPAPIASRNTKIELVDLREREDFGSHPLFSKPLLAAMKQTILNGKQVLLFHNRRGTARMSLCTHCGWVAECPNCHLPMRLHHDAGELRCHVCGHKDRLPQLCPECKNPDIDFKGFGSKRIEQEVKRLFPQVSVARFDSDTPAKQQLHHRYDELKDNKIKVIIGTQGIAKGLDLPHLDTVGIVQADSELFIPDYSSSERSFQLTAQVIGRAGRGGQASTVIIQTFNPDHPAIRYGVTEDYKAFYKYEVKEREAEHMPPFTYLLQLTTSYASSATAEKAATDLKRTLKNTYEDVSVRGPSPAFHEHRGRSFYWQLVVSSHKRSALVEVAKNLPSRWQFMLDPINLL